MMIRLAAKLSRASAAIARTSNLASISYSRPYLVALTPRFRLFHNGWFFRKPSYWPDDQLCSVSCEVSENRYMMNRMLKAYWCWSSAFRLYHVKVKIPLMKTLEEWRYSLCLPYCLKGDFDDAIEKLRSVQELTSSFLGVRVAAFEALVGLHLELDQDDKSSVLADKCLELIGKHEAGCDGKDFETLNVRAKAVKGLVELVNGNLESGSVALSYGEFAHAKQNFSLAKEVCQKVMHGGSENKDFGNPHVLAAGSMNSEGLMLGAMCALGQLESHLGNFGDAEDLLTRALTEAEESFGSHHPKIGVVLSCIALMFGRKAVLERSSYLLIQEGLYRRAIELLKAPPLEIEGTVPFVDRGDIVALARGGYAEVLGVQENRKDQGEKMKNWAEATWKNRRLSLAEALEISHSSSKVPIIDVRISRIL